MKDAEDEAFDELAKKQGSWGGGFQTKRRMAADKVQEPVLDIDGHVVGKMRKPKPAQETVLFPCCGYTDANAIKWNQFNGVVQCHMCGQVYTVAQPAQEPVAFICQNNLYMAGDVDEYCTATHIPLYTTSPKREWVGLTEKEAKSFINFYKMDIARFVEAKLKEKNS
jgi:hypothetical protein